jgi:ribonuclease HI
LVGSEANTTNNQMELRAVIEGLRALKERCNVTIRTDSQYVTKGITLWIAAWKEQGWVHRVKGQGKQPVKHRDLWEEIERLTEGHQVRWEWVRGHADDEDNIRCDELANRAARGLSTE